LEPRQPRRGKGLPSEFQESYFYQFFEHATTESKSSEEISESKVTQKNLSEKQTDSYDELVFQRLKLHLLDMDDEIPSNFFLKVIPRFDIDFTSLMRH
jgi:hypothetical protein